MRNYAFEYRNIRPSTYQGEMILAKIDGVFKAHRCEKYPRFASPVSRLRKTHAPGVEKRNRNIKDKKDNYLQQAQFISSYIIGQRLFKSQLGKIRNI